MFRSLLIAAVTAVGVLASQPALADDYTISIGTPLTGSSIPPGRVGLGVEVSVDKSWAALAPDEQQRWREYTELVDAEVTPPFPAPNIRAFLTKLALDRQYEMDRAVEQSDEIFLVVRVSETGVVSAVDIMRGSDSQSGTLTNMEKLLAYRYVRALLTTRFTPALLKGAPVASAFPMLIRSVTKMQ